MRAIQLAQITLMLLIVLAMTYIWSFYLVSSQRLREHSHSNPKSPVGNKPPLYLLRLAHTNGLIMVFRVTLVCDSRGTNLQHLFNNGNQWNTVAYKVVVLKGRKLWDLWKVAREELLTERADRVYLLGGICNLTSPVFVHGVRFFWPRKRMNNLAAELVQCEIDIYEDAVLHQLKGKVVLIPEMGADLIRYNQIDVPLEWMTTYQKDLDANLPLIHATTKDLNKAMGVKTPWTLDVLYKTTKSGVRYPKYSVLQDGLHPSMNTAERITRQILKDMDEFFEESAQVVLLIMSIPSRAFTLVYTVTITIANSHESSLYIDEPHHTNVSSSTPFVPQRDPDFTSVQNVEMVLTHEFHPSSGMERLTNGTIWISYILFILSEDGNRSVLLTSYGYEMILRYFAELATCNYIILNVYMPIFSFSFSYMFYYMVPELIFYAAHHDGKRAQLRRPSERQCRHLGAKWTSNYNRVAYSELGDSWKYQLYSLARDFGLICSFYVNTLITENFRKELYGMSISRIVLEFTFFESLNRYGKFVRDNARPNKYQLYIFSGRSAVIPFSSVNGIMWEVRDLLNLYVYRRPKVS